jgi:hypothetical protein
MRLRPIREHHAKAQHRADVAVQRASKRMIAAVMLTIAAALIVVARTVAAPRETRTLIDAVLLVAAVTGIRLHDQPPVVVATVALTAAAAMAVPTEAARVAAMAVVIRNVARRRAKVVGDSAAMRALRLPHVPEVRRRVAAQAVARARHLNHERVVVWASAAEIFRHCEKRSDEATQGRHSESKNSAQRPHPRSPRFTPFRSQ